MQNFFRKFGFDDLPSRITILENNIYIPAGSFLPATTNGAATGQLESATAYREFDVYDFDGGATEEGIFISLVLPVDIALYKAQFVWTGATGSSSGDTVEWGCAAGSLANDEVIDTALGTPQVISDTLLANNGTDLQISGQTPTITTAGGGTAGEFVSFKVYRNTDGTDDMAEDARLAFVVLEIQ